MAKNKTNETEGSVADFINSVDDEKKRADSFRLLELFEKNTGVVAKMWGAAIIGFGNYHYKYDSGHEGDAPMAGFSPRKNALVLYFSPVFDQREELLQQLGKHTTSKACIYIKKLADIQEHILEKIIVNAFGYQKNIVENG